MRLQEEYLAYMRKYIYPLINPKASDCTAKQTAHYLTGQRLTQPRGGVVDRVVVVAPSVDFTLDNTGAKDLYATFIKYGHIPKFKNLRASFAENFLSGDKFKPLSNPAVSDALRNVVSKVNGLGIPISFTTTINPDEIHAKNIFTIWVSHQTNPDPTQLGCHIVEQISDNKLESFIAISTEAMQPDKVHRAFLHELLHAFFIPHSPPLESDIATHPSAISEYYSDPSRREVLRALVEENCCFITKKQPTVMYPELTDHYHPPGKFRISEPDRIILIRQWERMRSPRPSKLKGQSLPKTDLLLAPVTTEELTFKPAPPRPPTQHSTWGPNHSTLRRRSIVSIPENEQPLAAQSVYMPFLYETMFVPFVMGMSKTLVPVIVQYTQLTIDPKTAENVVGVILTFLFFRLEVALISLGIQFIMRYIKLQLQAYHLSSDSLWYLELFLPFIIELFYKLYTEGLLTALFYSAPLSFIKMFTSFAATYLGVHSVKYLSKEKMD
jgi:hypothetical protein